MSLIDDIKRDRVSGTPGDWAAPYETYDNGWSLDTDGENTYVGIGVACADQNKPVAITAVESAFGEDETLAAKSAANAHHRAQIMDALGLTL